MLQDLRNILLENEKYRLLKGIYISQDLLEYDKSSLQDLPEELIKEDN